MASAIFAAAPAFATGSFSIVGNFTSNFNTNFGANAAAAQAAWNLAASNIEAHFSDPIHITITVDAVTGTTVFGQSSTFLQSFSYAALRAGLVADSKTLNDSTALGAGGSVSVADPVSGTHTWWTTTAEAKAIGLVADNLNTDGTTTFGTGNAFTFSGPITAGTFDFVGVAEHEISEVMGRLGLSGSNSPTTGSYSVVDLFSYTGAGTRGLTPGAGENFSINNGTTLLKAYNNSASNGLDSRDWASPDSGDAFDQFSNPSVVNGLTAVDLQELDVIGYDLVTTPEPATIGMLGLGLVGLIFARKRVRS